MTEKGKQHKAIVKSNRVYSYQGTVESWICREDI